MENIMKIVLISCGYVFTYKSPKMTEMGQTMVQTDKNQTLKTKQTN